MPAASLLQAFGADGGMRRMRRALPLLVQRGSALLHQQCWFWGCDIRRKEGNLLLEYGFVRQRDPEGKRSTQYTHRDVEGHVVRLWGSGFYYGDAEDGLFLNRFAFEPRLVRYSEDWQDPARLKEAPRFMDLARLCAACAWIAEYEAWVLAGCGREYRAVCIASGPKPSNVAAEVPSLWRDLATEAAALLRQGGMDGRARNRPMPRCAES